MNFAHHQVDKYVDHTLDESENTYFKHLYTVNGDGEAVFFGSGIVSIGYRTLAAGWRL